MKFIRALALSLLVCSAALAQNAALMPMPKAQFFDANGLPLAGGLIFTYQAGTSTPLATYTDSSGSVPNQNPVTLDAGGFANIWIGGFSYKVVAQNSSGVQQWSVDNVSNIGMLLKGSNGAGQLNYTAPYSGAVSRTIQAKLAEANVNVTDAGAVCDGVTDDTVAFNLALTWLPNGGRLNLPNRRCYLKSTWNLSIPNLTVQGSGPLSEIYYDGTGHVNDAQRAVYVIGAFSGLRPITGGLAIGATSFAATSSGNTSDLQPGDWLQIEEIDPTVADITYFDFAQVASVSGTTVNLVQPIRTTFPTYQTVNFRRFTNPLGGVALKDFKITTAYAAGSGLPGLIIAQCRGVLVDHVTVDSGKGITTYRAQDIVIRDSRVVRTTNQASEFGATVDLRVHGNYFGGEGTPTSLAIANVTLDLGLGFFDFSGNQINGAQNIGLSISYNVHDGTVTNNAFGFLTGSAGQSGGGGIIARGAQRLVVTGNNFSGAASTLTSTAISFGDATATNNIISTGNVIAWNNAQGYTQLHDAGYSANDLYIDNNAAGLTIARYFNSMATAANSLGMRLDATSLANGLTAISTIGPKTYMMAQPEDLTNGGLRFWGFNSPASTQTPAINLYAVNTPAMINWAGIDLQEVKSNGSGGYTSVGASDNVPVVNIHSGSNYFGLFTSSAFLGLGNWTGQVGDRPAADLHIRHAAGGGWPTARYELQGTNYWQMTTGATSLLWGLGGTNNAGVTSTGAFISGASTGITATAIAGACTFTITGGLITAKSGC